MGLRQSAEYMAWRENRATELVGPYAVKTAGGLLSQTHRRTSDGWIYGGRDAFCFFADNPVELSYLSPPGRLDQRTLLIAFQDCEAPQIQSIPGGPNLIVDFGGGREFAGAKQRMEQLVRLWQMWASGSDDPAMWKNVADVSGLPLYNRPARITSSPTRTFTGALVGVAASIAAVWLSATNLLQVSLLSGVAIGLLSALVVLLIGRFQPNFVSGFTLISVAGSTVASIVSFTQGNATNGFLWLILMLLLLLTRIWLPRVVPKTHGAGF